MHFLLFYGTFAIIVSSKEYLDFLYIFYLVCLLIADGLAVHPGDPFPSDLLKTNIITSEDIINDSDLKDPNDDEISAESLLNDDEDLLDLVTSTSTKSTPIPTKLHQQNKGRKNIFKGKLFSSSTTKTTTTTTPVSITEPVDDEPPVDETSPFREKSIIRKK